MKKLSLMTLAAAALFASMPSNDAQADTPKIALRPGAVTKLLTTRVAGSINVSVPAQLAGLQCSDITVYAQSTEMLPPPPGGFATQHKWTRSAKASGAALGACSYSIAVPANSNFNLSIGADSTDKCMLVGGQPTPNAYVTVSVPLATTKTFNFSSNMLCQNVY